MNEIIYDLDDVKALSDDELLDLLALSWNIDKNKFEVVGELPALGDSKFGFLRNTYLVASGSKMYYPLKGLEKKGVSFTLVKKLLQK